MILLKTSLYASSIIAVMLLIRRLCFRRVSKGFFVLIWMIIAVRMMLLMEMPWKINLFQTQFIENETPVIVRPQQPDNMITKPERPVGAQPATPVVGPTSGTEKDTDTNTGHLPEKEKKLSGREVLWLLYFGGIGVSLVLLGVQYEISRKKLREGIAISDDTIEQTIRSFGLRRRVKVWALDDTTTAFTYGVVRPTVVIPMDFWTMDKTQQKIVLDHELMHIASFDYLKRSLLRVAVILHWFNPLAHILGAVAKRDMEFYCDERVVLRNGEAIKKTYATTILEIATKEPPRISLYNAFGYGDMKKRLTEIMGITPMSGRAKRYGGGMVLLVMGMTLMTACAPAVIHKSDSVETNPTETTGAIETPSAEETMEPATEEKETLPTEETTQVDVTTTETESTTETETEDTRTFSEADVDYYTERYWPEKGLREKTEELLQWAEYDGYSSYHTKLKNLSTETEDDRDLFRMYIDSVLRTYPVLSYSEKEKIYTDVQALYPDLDADALDEMADRYRSNVLKEHKGDYAKPYFIALYYLGLHRDPLFDVYVPAEAKEVQASVEGEWTKRCLSEMKDIKEWCEHKLSASQIVTMYETYHEKMLMGEPALPSGYTQEMWYGIGDLARIRAAVGGIGGMIWSLEQYSASVHIHEDTNYGLLNYEWVWW